jgi:uncharacterized cupin superfamily protein
MPRRAKLVRKKGGLVPSPGDGWFVVNAARVRWQTNELFGQTCSFEGEPEFPHLGINLQVLRPGQPNCKYHRESEQEDFLVLAGTCRLLIEEKAILLKAWDFVHCPPETNHVFVGAGKGPCVILMTGARRPDGKIVYPVSKLARRYKAGVDVETPVPKVAYADSPKWQPLRGAAPLPRKFR